MITITFYVLVYYYNSAYPFGTLYYPDHSIVFIKWHFRTCKILEKIMLGLLVSFFFLSFFFNLDKPLSYHIVYFLKTRFPPLLMTFLAIYSWPWTKIWFDSMIIINFSHLYPESTFALYWNYILWKFIRMKMFILVRPYIIVVVFFYGPFDTFKIISGAVI